MLIEFTFDKKLLFLLIFPIFKQIDSNVKIYYAKKDNKLFRIFRLFLSYEISIIFLLISIYRNKTRKKIKTDESAKNWDDINSNKIVDYEVKRHEKIKKLKSFLFLTLLSIINISCYFYNYYVGNDNIKFSRNTIGIIFEFIMYSILSAIILKEKYYRHHYLTSIIIIFLLIGLFIIYFIQLEDKSEYYNIFWYFLFYTLLYGLFNVLLKKYYILNFHSTYYILLVIGAICIIPLLLYDIIAYFINKDKSGIIIGFKDNINDLKTLSFFLVDLISLFTFNVGIMLTIYYFTPFHFIISEFISELLKYYINMILFYSHDKTGNYDFIYETNNMIVFSFVFLINLLCSLVFNEIIILKFYYFEYYTKKYIKKRARIDYSSLITIEESSNDSNNEIDSSINSG